jgi:predicted protein tyrosine phosphatase
MNYIYNEFNRLSKEYRIWNRFINTVKYVGILDTFSDNKLFHMNHVIDNVWVSNLPRIRNHNIITKFDLIISFLDMNEVGISETAWINDVPHISYHQIPAVDYNPLTISNYKEMNETIDYYLQWKPTSKILLHCYSGKGRSNSAACAYIIYKHKLSPAEAINITESKIPRSNMNKLQKDSLHSYYKCLL